MAISQTISSIPQAGKRGIDTRTVFVTKQEAFQDHLISNTVNELNTYASQLNTTQQDINRKWSETSNYRQISEQARDLAVSSAMQVQQNVNLVSEKVEEIKGYTYPSGVTYTPTEIDNKIQNKALESFLGFNF